MEMPKKPAAVKVNKPPTILPGIGGVSTFLTPNALDKSKAKSPKPKSATKAKTEVKTEVSGLGTLTLPFNGLGSLLPPPVGLPTPPSRKRKSGAEKPKTLKIKTPTNGPPKPDDTKGN